MVYPMRVHKHRSVTRALAGTKILAPAIYICGLRLNDKASVQGRTGRSGIRARTEARRTLGARNSLDFEWQQTIICHLAEISVIFFIALQTLPFRSKHSESIATAFDDSTAAKAIVNQGNFLGAVKLIAECYPILLAKQSSRRQRNAILKRMLGKIL
jgi:hypothetical protein